MRKRLLESGRRSVAVALTAAMVLTAAPVGGVNAAQDTQAVNVESVAVNLPEPEIETHAVEVFNEDGSMEHVFLTDEKYDEVFYEAEDDEGATYTEDYSNQQINIPVKPEWHAMPAPSAGKYNFQYADLTNNGDDSENYCILIAGDGYTAAEQDKFLQLAQNIANYFLTRAPFSDPDIKSKINIRAVCTVSNVSGVQEGQYDANNPLDTFFKCTFWNNTIERLVVAHDSTHVWEIVEQYMPDCKCPIIVANTTKYGGAGGSFCTISANELAPDIAFHEFGHTGGGLSDEYWEATYESSNRHESPNRTGEGDASKCKWSDLVGKNGVGLYPFDESGVYDWYRPHQNCEMRFLNMEYCDVCKRQIRSVVKGVADNAVPSNAVINNAAELQDYCNKVSNGASTTGKTVTLNADIYLSGSNNLSCMKSFKGTFDGNGHKISGINMSSSDGEYGFIGVLDSSATVKNLHLENVDITGGGYYVGGIAGNCKGKITGCSVSGRVYGANGVGGIAGHTESAALIQDSYNHASVHSTEQVAGGIVGWAGGGTVNNNYSIGTITSDMSWKGGICGYATDTTFTNNYWMSGTASYGVQGGTVTECPSADFSNGTVTNRLNSVSNVWKQGDGYPVHAYSSQNVEQTTTSKQETTHDAFGTIEAENYSSNNGGVKDTNASASGGYNLGGVSNGTSITFDKVNFTEDASSVFMRYSSPVGTASGYVEVYSDDAKVGQITLNNNGSDWSMYGDVAGRLSAQIGAGTHKITLKFITTNSAYYVCNLDYFRFIRANGDTTAPEGYTFCTVSDDDSWHKIGAWSYYLGQWNHSVGYYKGGVNADDFTIQIAGSDKNTWGIQIALDDLEVKDGHTYDYRIDLTSTASGSVIHKEDIAKLTENTAQISSGNNTIAGSFTAMGTKAKILLELSSGINPGTELKFTGFSLKDTTPEATTQEETTTKKAEADIDWDSIPFAQDGAKGGALANQFKFYCDNPNVSLVNIQKPGFASEESLYVTFPTGVSGSSLGDGDYDLQGAGVALHVSAFTEEITVFTVTDATGTYTCYVYNAKAGQVESSEQTNPYAEPKEVFGHVVLEIDGLTVRYTWGSDEEILASGQTFNVYADGQMIQTGVAAGVYDYTFDSEGTHTIKITGVLNGKETAGQTLEVTLGTATTEAETKTIEGGIEINGYQVNAKTAGMRTVYSVDSEIDGKEVVGAGMVYSLEGYADDAEMFVGSESEFVKSYAGTTVGKMADVVSDSDIATSYAMTMKFGVKTVKEFTTTWKIRAYAKLSDGSYVYTPIYKYTIYDIADELYQGSRMANEQYHNFLYTDILSKVNKDYVMKDYDNVGLSEMH